MWVQVCILYLHLKILHFNNCRCYLSFHSFTVWLGIFISNSKVLAANTTSACQLMADQHRILYSRTQSKQVCISFTKTCTSRCDSEFLSKLTIHSETRRHTQTSVSSESCWLEHKMCFYIQSSAKVPPIQWPSFAGEAHLRAWKSIPRDYDIRPICHSLLPSNQAQMGWQNQICTTLLHGSESLF